MKGGQREPFPKKLLWCTLKLMRSISTELPNPRVSATTTTRFLEGLAWASVGVNWCLYQETSGEEAPAACVMSAKAARARVRTSRLAGPLRAAWGLGWGWPSSHRAHRNFWGLTLPEPPIATSPGTALPSLTARQARQNPTTLQVGPAAARGRDERHIY